MSRAPRNAAGQDWVEGGGGQAARAARCSQRPTCQKREDEWSRMAKRGAPVPNRREAVRLLTPRRDIRECDRRRSSFVCCLPKTSGDDPARRTVTAVGTLRFPGTIAVRPIVRPDPRSKCRKSWEASCSRVCSRDCDRSTSPVRSSR